MSPLTKTLSPKFRRRALTNGFLIYPSSLAEKRRNLGFFGLTQSVRVLSLNTEFDRANVYGTAGAGKTGLTFVPVQ